MRSLLAILLVAACSPRTDPESNAIQWDDGDSGNINGVRFRLADVDAPESRAITSAIGPAKCEAERLAGKKAKQFMIDLTSSGPLKFEWNGEVDRYGRKVGDVSVSRISVTMAGLRTGHLRPWEHDGSRQVEPKPDWCTSG